ncbi:hypothetical protein ACFVW5_41315, partial [Streptomyces sp. NPDC058232]|uniref:hypothetical protein n=1 Tax=Streptomyces sp. NPDC058232 TaxID=3346393 RepID=UPI0036EEF9F7
GRQVDILRRQLRPGSGREMGSTQRTALELQLTQGPLKAARERGDTCPWPSSEVLSEVRMTFALA